MAMDPKLCENVLWTEAFKCPYSSVDAGSANGRIEFDQASLAIQYKKRETALDDYGCW